MPTNFDALTTQISDLSVFSLSGKVVGTDGNLVVVSGLNGFASVGNLVSLPSECGTQFGEIISLKPEASLVFPADGLRGCALNAPVKLLDQADVAPDNTWLGRVIDPLGASLYGGVLVNGPNKIAINRKPPKATDRKRLGRRLETGMAVFNTFLPMLRGQRLGLFAGSGVGKSMLVADLCRGVETDVTVLALIGERGREVRDFIEDVFGVDRMKKTVVIAATSDQSALLRRRAALLAMSVAEFFRDRGAQVLFLCDSLTRFADAHREIAMACGEEAPARGYPSSTNQAIAELCERAGPGPDGSGDITALFSVLVAGSDMDEPLADSVRGILDGHVVLDRQIAERGRFPAVNVLRSVSRSLPHAATQDENEILNEARLSMANYSDVEVMLQAGLYEPGGNSEFDRAISQRPKLEAFLSQKKLSIARSYELLAEALADAISLE